MALSKCMTAVDEEGRELIRHGTTLFPIACYHDDLTEEPVPWHWHEELEAGIVTEGRAVVAAGSQRFILETGDGFFLNSGVLHAIWNASGFSCRLHSLVFHPRLIGGSPESVYWQKYVTPLMKAASLRGALLPGGKGSGGPAAAAVEEAWQAMTYEPPGYEFQVRASLSRLVFFLTGTLGTANSFQATEKALRDGERAKAMLRFIEDHYTEEIHVEDIAASALISPSECLRCFKNTIGATPIQYVKQFRVQKAAELLLSTNQKISDIGASCGFQEMSYFAKAFRECKKMTPSEYRKHLKLQRPPA